ncbi:polysaccharide deacetylase family protein [Rufibacter quisquiliarum]|uniref:Peptidoglycan/xylan/chitin deacetylase (PgdA/CDA1 family) n=1 Tax=Rufibacter quisquiliarum TaxID=1549639 RepID=A0A839GVX2_9BACT|nr:polysaccharide deacetylase family protein [Rufibacter quisquiliarum]MBA9077901.1 peptidoglycan/xylan/chitin deacetylase (PgdA/CDA1 family) [Rufibacter quisquiliarum]
MRFHQTPALLRWLFPRIWWKKSVQEKVIFLTFDDGPIPEVTDFVLGQLDQYQAKATFFWVGDNVERYPEIAKRVLAAGHRVGNHTYHHVQAWKNRGETYGQEVQQCQQALERAGAPAAEKLFRPPHGQLTFAHLRKLQPEYQVVMWSSLTYDFDASLPAEECLSRSIASIKPGSIVVMHDSLKAEKNLRYVLPRLLQHFSSLGYSFKTL